MKRITQRNRKNGKKLISNVALDYMSNTSIHGLGYLGAKDKNIVEKIWWLLVFVTSLIACIYLISQTWIKWVENPIVVSFSTKQIKVSQIPFPAVTVCPTNRIKQSSYNYTHALLNYKHLYGSWLKRFLDISLICDPHGVDIPKNSTADVNTYTNIWKASPSLQETIPAAMWRFYIIAGRLASSTEFWQQFEPQITEEGLCFTFNAFGPNELYTSNVRMDLQPSWKKNNTGWNLKDGYTVNATGENLYPLRAFRDGAEAGLQILLRSPATERDTNCGPRLSGYKIYLHNPAEPPRINEQHILLADQKFMVLSVTPNMVTTSQGLKNFPPHIRNCYFTHEKHLMYYSTYTQTNCRLDCTANLTKELCGCLPFYMPREDGIEICAFSKKECLNHTRTIIFNHDMKMNLNDQEKTSRWYKIIEQCDCLPACTLLEYRSETSQAHFHFTNDSMPMRLIWWYMLQANDGMKYTKLNIFFRDRYFIATHRNELFTQIDFLSNCGGLLGLCMGFSILSLLEIVYFLTIRICCKLRKSSQGIKS